MTEKTARFALPLIVAGQAQKERTVAEAMTLIDMLLHGCVEGMGENVPPAGAVAGDCWIVGDMPTAAWSGMNGHVACWTDGGWRYAAPRTGMRFRISGERSDAIFANNMWQRTTDVEATPQVPNGRIGDVEGGAVQDAQARVAIAAILSAMRAHNLIAT